MCRKLLNRPFFLEGKTGNFSFSAACKDREFQMAWHETRATFLNHKADEELRLEVEPASTVIDSSLRPKKIVC